MPTSYPKVNADIDPTDTAAKIMAGITPYTQSLTLLAKREQEKGTEGQASHNLKEIQECEKSVQSITNAYSKEATKSSGLLSR